VDRVAVLAVRPVPLEEVVAIYLPLSRLLSLYVAATQGLFKATQRFLLAENEGKVPYIIGIAGSVAVGKSTTARVLKALLARWPDAEPHGQGDGPAPAGLPGDFGWGGYFDTSFTISPSTGLVAVIMAQEQPGPGTQGTTGAGAVFRPLLSEALGGN
jgi:CubicO group peptidase (beta-lactamase class C family)